MKIHTAKSSTGWKKEEIERPDAEAKACDLQRFAAFFRGMLDRGIYTAPSQFEANFVSAAHADADVRKTLQAADETLASLAAGP